MELLTREGMIASGVLRDTGQTCKTHGLTLYARKMPNLDNKETLINHDNREIFICWECANENIRKRAKDTDLEYSTKAMLANGYDLFKKESILSADIAKATLKNYEVKTDIDDKALNYSKRIIMDYLKGMEGNAVLQGPPGVGKSHLSISIAKNLNEMFKSYNQQKSVIFVSFSLLTRLVKDTFKYNDKESKYSEERMTKLLTECDYLIIDDLGKESSTGNTIEQSSKWTYTFLFNILDNRKNTIINTNFQTKDLAKIYDKAMLDRIMKGAKNNTFNYPDNAESKRF